MSVVPAASLRLALSSSTTAASTMIACSSAPLSTGRWAAPSASFSTSALALAAAPSGSFHSSTAAANNTLARTSRAGAPSAGGPVDQWKLGPNAEPPMRRCWPNAADFRYPKEDALEQDMATIVERVLNAQLPETELLKVVSMWTLYQRGPYHPYNARIFSCIVATYSRLGLHVLALRVFTSFPQVRWEPRFVFRAVAQSAEIMGSVQPMMALLRLMERSGYRIGARELDTLAVTCIRAGDFARAKGVLQRIECSFPAHVLKPRVLMEVLRSSLGVKDWEKAARSVVAIVPTFPLERILDKLHAAASEAVKTTLAEQKKRSSSSNTNNKNDPLPLVSLPALYTDASMVVKGYMDLFAYGLQQTVEEGQDAQSAFLLFRSVLACGFTPYTLQCLSALQLAAKMGHGALAEISLCCLLARWGYGARPTPECYALLCRAYARGGDFTGALRVLQLAHHFSGATVGDVFACLPSLRAEIVSCGVAAGSDAHFVAGLTSTGETHELIVGVTPQQQQQQQQQIQQLQQQQHAADGGITPEVATTPAVPGAAAPGTMGQHSFARGSSATGSGGSEDAEWEWKPSAEEVEAAAAGAALNPSTAVARSQQREAQSLLGTLSNAAGQEGASTAADASASEAVADASFPAPNAAITGPAVPSGLAFIFPDRRRHSSVLNFVASTPPSLSSSPDPKLPQPSSYLLYCALAGAEEAASMGRDWHVGLMRHWEDVAAALRPDTSNTASSNEGDAATGAASGAAVSRAPSRMLELVVEQRREAVMRRSLRRRLLREGQDLENERESPADRALRLLSPASLASIHVNGSSSGNAGTNEASSFSSDGSSSSPSSYGYAPSYYGHGSAGEHASTGGFGSPGGGSSSASIDLTRWKELQPSERQRVLPPSFPTAAAASSSSSGSSSSSSGAGLSPESALASLSMSQLLTEVRHRAGLTWDAASRDTIALVPTYDRRARLGSCTSGLGLGSLADASISSAASKSPALAAVIRELQAQAAAKQQKQAAARAAGMTSLDSNDGGGFGGDDDEEWRDIGALTARGPWDRALMRAGLFTDVSSEEDYSRHDSSKGPKVVIDLRPGLPVARFGAANDRKHISSESWRTGTRALASGFGTAEGMGADSDNDTEAEREARLAEEEEEEEQLRSMLASVRLRPRSAASKVHGDDVKADAAPASKKQQPFAKAIAPAKAFTIGSKGAAVPAQQAKLAADAPYTESQPPVQAQAEEGDDVSPASPARLSEEEERSALLPYTSAVASPVVGILLEAFTDREGRKLPDLTLALGRHMGYQPTATDYASLAMQFVNPPFVDLDSSNALFKAMAGSGHAPNSRVYDQLMVALARAGRVDKAMGVFNQALDRCPAASNNTGSAQEEGLSELDKQRRLFQAFPSPEAVGSLVRCIVLKATGELPDYDKEASEPPAKRRFSGDDGEDGADGFSSVDRGSTHGDHPSAVLNRGRNAVHIASRPATAKAKADIEAILGAIAKHLLPGLRGGPGGPASVWGPLALDPRVPSGESNEEWKASLAGDPFETLPTYPSPSSVPPLEPADVAEGTGNTHLQGPLISRYREWRVLHSNLSEYAARRLGVEVNGFKPDSGVNRINSRAVVSGFYNRTSKSRQPSEPMPRR